MKHSAEALWTRHPELSQLLWCLQNGEEFNLYICQFSSVPYRQQLCTVLQQSCAVVEVSALSLPIEHLIDEALHIALQSSPSELPVFIYDLERLLLTVDDQRNLQYVRQLNWRRSGFQRLQRNVVLWLPLAALDLLARYAPDFYDWCSGFYYFAEPQVNVVQFNPTTFENDKVSNLSLSEKQSWLVVLQESLTDDSLSVSKQASISLDIGDLYVSIGKDNIAEQYFRDALSLYQSLEQEKNIAVTQGRLANILYWRGQLDEALAIRQQEQLPIFERLGDVRSKAVTMGYIADILQSRGQLDEALAIRQQEQLPVYERLGDVREKAVTMGKIADILQSRGQLDEALAIRQQEELPVYERLGDVRNLLVTRAKLAIGLLQKTPPDIAEAQRLLQAALQAAEQMQIPEAETIRKWIIKAKTIETQMGS